MNKQNDYFGSGSIKSETFGSILVISAYFFFFLKNTYNIATDSWLTRSSQHHNKWKPSYLHLLFHLFKTVFLFLPCASFNIYRLNAFYVSWKALWIASFEVLYERPCLEIQADTKNQESDCNYIYFFFGASSSFNYIYLLGIFIHL